MKKLACSIKDCKRSLWTRTIPICFKHRPKIRSEREYREKKFGEHAPKEVKKKK